jgi:hypothetical protein
MLAFFRHHRVSILWLVVVFGALLSLRLLGLSSSKIGSLMWLAVFFVVLFSFIRGMDALQQIATRLERIEHILTDWPPTGANPSASHTAT